MAPPTTRLSAARPADHALLSNLLELYIHDLSAIFPHVRLGADGRFGYPGLASYWAEPERRFAFVIEEDGQTAGFVLATRGSPAVTDPDVYDVAEFFVLRRYRGSGVGRRAASLLWAQLPGRWVVRVSAANAPALGFWSRVVSELSGGEVTRSTRPGSPSPWHVFELDSAAPRGA
jgi:predicted acetyltransferase